MINTLWESRVWHSDMQLIGKVALSATAVVILALAYRFYKFRKVEGTAPNGKHDPSCGTEKNSTVETPLRDYIGAETGNLRFRCVHNNLQNNLVADHGNKNLADVSVTAHRAQEGSLTSDVTCTDQSGLNNGQLHKEEDPQQSQRQIRDDTTGQERERDGEETINKTQSQDYRQEPEGGEMQEKTKLANSLQEQGTTMQTEDTFHQVISTQMQEDFIPDGDPTQMLTTGDLKEKNVKSSSQSDTDEVDHHFGNGLQSHESPLTEFTPDGDPMQTITTGGPREKMEEPSSQSATDEENRHLDIGVHGHPSPLTDLLPSTSQQELTNDGDTKEESQNQNVDNQEKENNEKQTQGIQSDRVSLATASSLFSNQPYQSRATTAHPRPNIYHISLDEELTVDIHLDLANCYDVLCLAKKNNHDVLIAAAYKMMSDDYLQVLQNPNIYGRLNATERDFILESRMKGRRFVVVADIDTQVANASENQSSLSYYDSDNDYWHTLSRIPSEAVSRGCSMATLFNYIFIALGSDGLGRQMKPSKRVLCYNPLTDTWKEVAPLKEARPHCKLVALDGCLYAIGGECLHTVERYDPRQNRWSYIAPLPNDTFAVAHMATAYDDEIYVTGGTIRYMLLRYNLREKMWKNSLISGSKDRTTEIVIANNFLYRFDLNRSMGISVHRCNIRARIWYECATYAIPYPSPFQCVAIDNNIYCISRNFHLRFLADDVSPRFMDVDLQTVPLPKGILYPLVLVLPVKDM
ncbi:kelch domain-containing protein 7A [Leptodactylus fuscus]|uniref:kelch domain-containing protein 7A n=1 Tax=Leptodactylus fuscus TaxID=238119 RepID=UPI003F4F0492